MAGLSCRKVPQIFGFVVAAASIIGMGLYTTLEHACVACNEEVQLVCSICGVATRRVMCHTTPGATCLRLTLLICTGAACGGGTNINCTHVTDDAMYPGDFPADRLLGSHLSCWTTSGASADIYLSNQKCQTFRSRIVLAAVATAAWIIPTTAVLLYRM